MAMVQQECRAEWLAGGGMHACRASRSQLATSRRLPGLLQHGSGRGAAQGKTQSVQSGWNGIHVGIRLRQSLVCYVARRGWLRAWVSAPSGPTQCAASGHKPVGSCQHTEGLSRGFQWENSRADTLSHGLQGGLHCHLRCAARWGASAWPALAPPCAAAAARCPAAPA